MRSKLTNATHATHAAHAAHATHAAMGAIKWTYFEIKYLLCSNLISCMDFCLIKVNMKHNVYPREPGKCKSPESNEVT